ncbi:MAG: transglycosylase domain-containing protein [Chloroflexota bacterium]|nr:transglycosylase domain-containing protein [Chloroflexota bacterium]
MPDDLVKPPADDDSTGDAPLSPEEMMGRMLNPQPKPDQAPPPEDYLSPQPEAEAPTPTPAPPEDLAASSPPAANVEKGAATLPPPRPQINSRIREAAEGFIKMQNQAATLADMLRSEEISFEEYQRLLYDSMAQDEDGAWWMIDAENEQWYRHDSAKNEWVSDYPAALREWEAFHQAHEAKTPSDAESDMRTETVYDLPPSYLGPTEPGGGAPILDDRGVEIGRMPRTKDALYTVPGTAAFKSELPGQERTAPSDPQFARTQPAQTRFDDAGDHGEVIPRAIDYELERSPIVEELLESRRRNSLRALANVLVALLVIALVSAIAGAGGIMFWYSDTVKPFQGGIAALADYSPEYQTARIFDADGGLIAALNSQETGARTTIPLERVSPYMIHAIVAQENERYFEDPGFDPIAIARAFIQNLSGGGIESGASTITQQIARNLVLRDSEVTVQRKVNEILVALEIANQYDKNFILELYLNEVFFANQNYGVEAASQFYFGHGADELNFAQAALLASIVPSPAKNDPVINRPVAVAGMRATMRKMIDIGCLQFQHGDWPRRGPFCVIDGREIEIDGSPQVLARANADGKIVGGAAIVQIAEIETTPFEPLTVQLRYPHFVNFVRAQLEVEVGANGLFQRGFNIYTTLDPATQDAAQQALSNQVNHLVGAATGVNTGAVMVTDPRTGAIRAMVGSHNFDDEFAGQVNNALTWQQPGSVIKPFIYAAALQGAEGNYLTPASIVWDVPTTYDMGVSGPYSPVNIDGRFRGPMSLRAALQNSRNVATIKVYEQVGKIRFAEMAGAVGLQFPEDSLITLSSALGANEVTLYDMMAAYGVLANRGRLMPLYAIERITETIDGEEVALPRERADARGAISPALAYLMQNILSDDASRQPSFNPGSALTLAHIGLPTQNVVSAKTGTSNGARDLWTMGFTRDAVVGVWLGTSDNSPTYNTSGITSAAPVWNAVMTAASLGKAPMPFENPGGVVAREICRATGTLNYSACPDPSTGLFLHEQYPPPAEQAYIKRIAVDSWTGLLANEFCNSNVVEKTYVAVDDPAALDWLAGSAEGQAFVKSIGIELPVLPVPQAECAQGQSLPLINISAPNNGAVVRDAVEIRGQARGPDFDRFELSYAFRDDPDKFLPISAALVEMPNYGTVLGVWDTRSLGVPDGEYILRLAAYSSKGGNINYDINLRVENPTPTTTPEQAIFQPTIVSLPLATPVP